MTIEVEESVVGTRFGRTYVRTVGIDQPGMPLIVVHGGPGMTWDYLDTFDWLAETGIPVVYYDQLGSGKSAGTSAGEVSLDRLLDQLSSVIKETAAGKHYALLGHSSGCILAFEHALKGDPRLAGLVIGGGFSDVGDFVASVSRLCEALPEKHRHALVAGDHRSEAYKDAADEFFVRHVCRISPTPPGLQRSLAALANNSAVFERLWGPTVFDLSGDYAGWSVKKRLGEIVVPALVYRGEYDEAGSECSAPIMEGLANAREVVIAGASHLAHAEAKVETLDIVRDFVASLSR